MALLNELGANPRPVGLAALSAASGLSKTTTRRLLISLVHHGLCERTAAGEYRLGLRLFELGMVVQAQLDLRERSRALLERLAETTHLTVFLCIREQDRAICIERIDGRFAHSLALRLGGTLPLHAGAAPLVLLAQSEDADIQRYLDNAPFDRFTSRTLSSAADVHRAVEACRRNGYAISDQDVTDGVAAIGAPVLDHTGSTIAAISVSGLVPHVLGEHQDRIIGLVVEAAGLVASELGFRKEVTPAGVGVPGVQFAGSST